MNKILIIALNYIKNYLLANFVYDVILACFAFLVCLTLIILLFKIIFKKNSGLKYFNGFFTVTLIVCVNAILIELQSEKSIFKDYINVVIISSSIVILGVLCNLLIGAVKFKEKKNIKVNDFELKSDNKEQKEKSIEVISCSLEPTTVYGGYVDVRYLKELIDKLKEKELEEYEAKRLEEFEVYLLNFVNRQPSAFERVKLSEYVGELIKTLSKYEVA